FGTRRQLLDFVRIKVAAGFDNDVFHAAGYKNLSVGAVSSIARIHPGEFAISSPAVREKFLGCGRVVVVATGRRRSAEPQEAFGAISNFAPRVVHNSHVMIRNSVAG